MSSCSQHANEKAVGYCVNCDELVCAICRKEIDGKGYCTVCADKLFASTEVKSEQPPPPASDEPWGPPLPSAARPAPLRAIKAKIEAAPVLQAARAVEPESLPAKAASEPAKTRLVPPGVKQPVSNLWWLLPLLFTWIGGVIAGLLTKGRDPKKALHMFLTGLGMTFVHGIVIIALLAGSAPPPPEQPPASSTDQTSSVTSAAGRQPSASAANQQASGATSAGQTQVGQTAVATNGQVIDVMAQPKTTPYPASPIPDYKLVPISTQAVQPSDKEQSLNCGDILQVIIPGGELKEQQNLVVSSVDNSPPCSPGETRLAVYDISFEKQHEFNSNLAFKFKYDSALIKGDRPPEMALGVACFDNITQHWLPVASKVDSSAGTITALTQHNGLWLLVECNDYRNVLITEHCAVIYYPFCFWTPGAARYLELKAQYDSIMAKKNQGLKDAATYEWPIETAKEFASLDSDPKIRNRRSLIEYAGKIPADDRHYYTDNPDVPTYIVDMGYFADHAWNVYRDNFNTEPLQKSITFVSYNYLNKDSVLSGGIIQPPYYSTDVLAFLIYVDPEDIDPQYSTLTGNIDIGDGLALTDDLPETISHEMFHAMQFRQYWGFTRAFMAAFTFGDTRSEWWMDSTAEYAAFKLATDHAVPTHKQITSGYLAQDFYSWAPFGSETRTGVLYDVFGDTLHRYKNAFFYDFLYNEHGLEFVPLYNSTATDSSPSEGLDIYLQAQLFSRRSLDEPSLNEYYNRFAEYLVMDEKSPMGAMTPTALSLSENSGGFAFRHPLGLTCGVLGLRPEIGNSGGRTFLVSIAAPDIYYSRIDLFVLKDGKRQPTFNFKPTLTWRDDAPAGGGDLGHPLKLGEIKIGAGDDLYIFSTCDSLQTPTVFLEDKVDPSLSIESDLPSGTNGIVCTGYNFVAIHEQMPDGTTYAWTVDGNKADSTADTLTHKFSSAGDHIVKATASWEVAGQSESIEATATAIIGQPKLTITGPKELKQGEKGVMGDTYTFSVEPEYVPTGATYVWDSSGDTGREGRFTPPLPGPAVYTVKVTASWDINGCKGKKEGSTRFEIEKEYIDINANPAIATAGQSVTFTATGHVRRTAVFSWNYGDEAGIGTIKMETPVSHKYAIAGKYTVTVTAMDKQGNTLADKTIQYLVKPAGAVATVGIIPPPDIASGQGRPKTSYRFVAAGEKVPENAIYTWSMGARELGQGESIPLNFSAAGTYTLKLVARWTDAGGQPQQAEARLDMRISEPVELYIIPPPEIQNKTAKESTKYYFAFNTGIPSTATFTWYSDGQEAGKGETIGLAFSSGQHIVELKANWQDSDAAKTKREQKATPLSFNIVAATTLPAGHGWYLVKTITGSGDTYSCSEGSCSWKKCKINQSLNNPILTPSAPDIIDDEGNIVRYTPVSPIPDDEKNKPAPCDPYTLTVSWTKFPSFLKPNSDFYCSVTKSPPDMIYEAAIIVRMGVPEVDLIYENYYDLAGQQKIWIPDGSKASVPFFTESKLAGKTLQIYVSNLGAYEYEYK